MRLMIKKLGIIIFSFFCLNMSLVFNVAYAQYPNPGDLLTGDDAPEWAVYLQLGGFSCAGALISPKVVITAAHCSDNFRSGSTNRVYNYNKGAYVNVKSAHYTPISGKINDVGILILEGAFSGVTDFVKLPNYKSEDTLLQSQARPNWINPEFGTRLRIYGSSTGLAGILRMSSLATGHGYSDTPAPAAPLTYRSFAEHRKQNRMCVSSEQDQCLPYYYKIISPWSKHNYYYGELGHDDRSLDSYILTTSSYYAIDYAAFGVHYAPGSPVRAGDSGGAIVALAENGDEYLVGVVGGNHLHTRVRRHWDWIIDDIRQALPNSSDLTMIEDQIYNIKRWGDNHRIANVGEYFKRDNNSYLQLIKKGNDGKYWYYPPHGANNGYWRYAGNVRPDEYMERGGHFIINKATKQCLTLDRDALKQSDCVVRNSASDEYDPDQLWEKKATEFTFNGVPFLLPENQRSYYLENTASGKCVAPLDDKNNYVGYGVWNCAEEVPSGYENDAFHDLADGEYTKIFSSLETYPSSNMYTARCLDVQYGHKNQNLIMYRCHNGDNQKFVWD